MNGADEGYKKENHNNMNDKNMTGIAFALFE